jgi:hypothetical protein
MEMPECKNGGLDFALVEHIQAPLSTAVDTRLLPKYLARIAWHEPE